MARYQRVFAALDGGSTQRSVAQRAIDEARANNAALMLGHVTDSVPYEAAGVDYTALCEEVAAKIEEDLADILEVACKDDDIPSIELVVKAGRINDTLTDALIGPFDPDLVVCGERGLSNIKYAFVGSVSTHLIRTVDCDVLVLKHH